MRQRVMIAMALACQPQILIADEPTTALDVTIQAQILDLIRDLNQKMNTSVVFITHDLGVVSELCDTVIVMYNGHIVEKAPVADIFREPLHPYTQGLLSAIPRITKERKPLSTIEGMVPNPVERIKGCRFWPRCPKACDRCRKEEPPVFSVGEDRQVRCWLYAQADNGSQEAVTNADESKNKDVLVHADHVKVYFKGKDKKSGTVRAVDDISFDIFAGETFGVVGESGCGKSTLGRTLIRLIPATDGHVYLDGEDISGLKGKALKQMRKKAQIIFQDPSACLNPRRTVRQILMEPFQIHHMTGSMDVDARIEELLHLVGLDTYHLSRYPHELSGGQKQRIGIARALALEPKLIICDEAVSALDVSVQAQVLNLLQELKERLGLTYFFISHNLNVVYQVSDRVGVMYLGKMVEIAAYDQLYEKRYHPYTEALLSAIPQVDADDRTERIHLTGEVPSPSNPPSGCPFHTRCPKACDICSKEIPQLKEIEKGHFVACHLYQ